MSKLAWIGLGTMGFPMAGHLKTRGGYAVDGVQPHARQGRCLGRQVWRKVGALPGRGRQRR